MRLHDKLVKSQQGSCVSPPFYLWVWGKNTQTRTCPHAQDFLIHSHSLVCMKMWLLLLCLWENNEISPPKKVPQMTSRTFRALAEHQPKINNTSLALLLCCLQRTMKNLWGGSFNQQNIQMTINKEAEQDIPEMRICKCLYLPSLEILWVCFFFHIMNSNLLHGYI